MTDSKTVHIPEATTQTLRGLVERVGVDRAAGLLRITRTVLTCALAGFRVRTTTAGLIELSLSELRDDPDRQFALRCMEIAHRPVGMFVEQCCEKGPDMAVGALLLFQAWERWCEAHNTLPRSVGLFERRLLETSPGVRSVRMSQADKRPVKYAGIRLKA